MDWEISRFFYTFVKTKPMEQAVYDQIEYVNTFNFVKRSMARNMIFKPDSEYETITKLMIDGRRRGLSTREVCVIFCECLNVPHRESSKWHRIAALLFTKIKLRIII